MQEGKTADITLMEDDPEIVDRMIDYLYRLDFDDQPSSANNKALEGRLVINARVYAIAEKYELCSLKAVAKVKTAGEKLRFPTRLSCTALAVNTITASNVVGVARQILCRGRNSGLLVTFCTISGTHEVLELLATQGQDLST